LAHRGEKERKIYISPAGDEVSKEGTEESRQRVRIRTSRREDNNAHLSVGQSGEDEAESYGSEHFKLSAGKKKNHKRIMVYEQISFNILC
jgi:hypothetical protein